MLLKTMIEKKKRKQRRMNSSEEYVLISTLTRSVSPRNDTWLIDSGASKCMTGFKESLSCLEQKESPHKVMLGDDSQYPIKGLGEEYYKLDYRNPMKMKDVLSMSQY